MEHCPECNIDLGCVSMEKLRLYHIFHDTGGLHYRLPECLFSPSLNITSSQDKSEEDTTTPALRSPILARPRCLQWFLYERAIFTWIEEPPGNEHLDVVRQDFQELSVSSSLTVQFVEYDKMIYMDADIQVFDNIDHLFDLPSGYFYGVVDCLCEMYGYPCPEKLRWPHELGPRPDFYLNGGMFMFEPDLTTYRHLISTLEVTPPTPFAEQDFLNMFFREKMKPIPYIYNLLVAMLWRHPEAVNLEKAKVVHYCMAGSKPWRYTGEGEHMDRPDIKMLVNKWWDIYNDVPQAQCTHVSFTGDVAEAKKRAVVMPYRSASSAA